MPTGVYARKPRTLPDPLTRFWKFVQKSEEPNGCWLWIGGLRRGYGQFWVAGQSNVPAHRYIYERTHGELPGDIEVCHVCDCRPCVRDDHLFPGTPTDNHNDAVQKGRKDADCLGKYMRHTPPKGEACGNSKLTEEQVREILAMDFSVRGTQRYVADLYNVSKYAIYSIRTRKTWAHLSLSGPSGLGEDGGL